ncbi:MAG: MBL fold metallo-hydrolase [Lachnospiraceae bacterium]|nr:MBL fold metallo-hydrolase [Lachnospiraceae bacterium]
MPGGTLKPNRYIKSDLKSHRILWEDERPDRWPYLKMLRETSNLKEFYPEINPYVEAYKVRENTWAMFQESMDGAGDLWMYLINGPEKALLIDTGFGVGDLKGLVQHLIGDKDKEIIVANTHHHYDHAYGNAQFDKCYCHQDEEYSMRYRAMNPHIWDYLFDENGKNIYTEFDRADLITYKDYELIPIPSGYIFDLGDGYEVEAMPIRAHSAGQCAYLDKHNHTLFTGDIGGAGRSYPGDPCAENCTIETMWRDVQYVVSRLDEIEGLFPGHGMLDVSSVMLKNQLEALDRIMEDPKNADSIKKMVRNGEEMVQYAMNIRHGSTIKYNLSNVYRRTPYRR